MRAKRLILPGVGAFAMCADKLRESGLVEPIMAAIQSGVPFLGICVGLQVLFESSEETMGAEIHPAGLGILKGEVRLLRTGELKIPHIGWNSLQFTGNPSRLLSGIPGGSYFYFVHSYAAAATDRAIITATADYGCTFDAVAEKSNIFATQFHPEKSGDAGLALLENFCKI